MLLAALAASGNNASQILGSYKAAVVGGDNMLLLSLLSRHESTQSERVRHAALFDIQSIPEYAEVLPENTITTGGTISEAVVPSEAAFLPMTDVSQIFGAG